MQYNVRMVHKKTMTKHEKGVMKKESKDRVQGYCFGTRETIGVRDEHLITKQF